MFGSDPGPHTLAHFPPKVERLSTSCPSSRWRIGTSDPVCDRFVSESRGCCRPISLQKGIRPASQQTNHLTGNMREGLRYQYHQECEYLPLHRHPTIPCISTWYSTPEAPVTLKFWNSFRSTNTFRSCAYPRFLTFSSSSTRMNRASSLSNFRARGSRHMINPHRSPIWK